MPSLKNFPLDIAEMLGTLIESIFYGMAVVLLLRTISKFRTLRKEGVSVTNPVFQVVPYIFLVAATLHLTIDWFRLIYAFLNFETSIQRIEFLGDVRTWHYPVKDTIFGVLDWTSDAILVYRCYIIWNRSYMIVAIPALTFLGCLISGWGVIVSEGTKQFVNVFDGNLHKFITVFLVCTTANTLICIFLTLLKVYLTQRSVTSGRKATGIFRLVPSLAIVLESGVIYCFVVLTLLALYFTNSPAQVIMLNSLNCLIPVLFCSVLLGIGKGVKRPSQVNRSYDNSQITSRRRGIVSTINHDSERTNHFALKPDVPNESQSSHSYELSLMRDPWAPPSKLSGEV